MITVLLLLTFCVEEIVLNSVHYLLSRSSKSEARASRCVINADPESQLAEAVLIRSVAWVQVSRFRSKAEDVYCGFKHPTCSTANQCWWSFTKHKAPF